MGVRQARCPSPPPLTTGAANHRRPNPNPNGAVTACMGVRQAVWRQKLWAEPDMRIVSAGIPDYLEP